MTKRLTVTVCGTVLLIAVVVVVALRNRQQPAPTPNVPVAVSPTEVRVKAEERNPVATIATAAFDASRAVAIICGEDSATADRYEARNKVLRSIARRSDLPKEDVTALMAYLQSVQDKLRPERVAALKNDVINLLRCQEKPAEGLMEALITMFSGGRHPPAVLDYCIQHLGAMQNDIKDASLRRRVRKTFVNAAARKNQPYAGNLPSVFRPCNSSCRVCHRFAFGGSTLCAILRRRSFGNACRVYCRTVTGCHAGS